MERFDSDIPFRAEYSKVFSVCAYSLADGLCIFSHLLQDEASVMMAE